MPEARDPRSTTRPYPELAEPSGPACGSPGLAGPALAGGVCELPKDCSTRLA